MYTAEGGGVRGYFWEGEKFVTHPPPPLPLPTHTHGSWPKQKNDNPTSLTEESKTWAILYNDAEINRKQNQKVT